MDPSPSATQRTLDVESTTDVDAEELRGWLHEDVEATLHRATGAVPKDRASSAEREDVESTLHPATEGELDADGGDEETGHVVPYRDADLAQDGEIPLPSWLVTETEEADEVDTVGEEASQTVPSQPLRSSLSHFFLEVLETVVLTLLIFVCMRGLIQNYRIEGYSMEPNLHQGQYLIVNKAAYYFAEPQRGDIIVFESPWTTGLEERDYIKRVIGLPGDTVEVRDGTIYINDEPIDEAYGPNPINYPYQRTTMGPGEYFVLGDNRSASRDSHLEGPLERRYIIGKAAFIYLPIDNVGPVPNATINAAEPASASE